MKQENIAHLSIIDMCSGRIRIKQNVTPKWVYWLNQVDMAVVTSVNNG